MSDAVSSTALIFLPIILFILLMAAVHVAYAISTGGEDHL